MRLGTIGWRSRGLGPRRLGTVAGGAAFTLLTALGGYWPFDGDADDVSGNGHDGAESGGITYAAAQVGDGAVNDGTGKITITHAASLMLGGGRDWSVAFWADITGAGLQGLFGKWGFPGDGDLLIFGNTADVQFVVSRSDDAQVGASIGVPGDGVMRFWAVTWNDRTKVLSYRMDGTTGTLSVPLGLKAGTTRDIEFGSDDGGTELPVSTGDELGVWSSLPGGGGCLSSALLDDLENAGLGTTWPFL